MNFVNDIVPFQLQEKQEVVIEKIVRNKRKCVTVVKGLELFGELFSERKSLQVKWSRQSSLEWVATCMINWTLLEVLDDSCFQYNEFDYMFFPEPLGVKLSDASKKLGKKFATGASVVKVPCRGLWCYSGFGIWALLDQILLCSVP